MVEEIINDKLILKSFPELTPMFNIEQPPGSCKPCTKNVYLTKLRREYANILESTGIKESDIRLYFDGKYGKPHVTVKGIVAYANSLLRRSAATVAGEEVMVDEDIYLSRLKTCRNCEFFTQGICSICTCPVHEKCKRYTDSCPESKW